MQLDTIPSKKYMLDYIDLIEAKILLDSSINFSSSKGVSINITNYRNEAYKAESQSLTNTNTEKYQTIYKLMLQNVNFPEINNVDKLLRLRENKKINLFKSNVEYWNTALKTNEFKELKSLENHLVKANKAIRSLEIRKQRDWIFYVAVGMEIVGLLSQIPLSLIPTAYSSAIKIDSFIKKRKYNWLMIE